MRNFYPFAMMPTAAHLDSLERRAIYCEKQGYHKIAARHWSFVEAGEAMRRDAGLDIYEDKEADQ